MKNNINHIRRFIILVLSSFGIVTIVGMISNIIILVTGYIITLPHLFDFIKGYYMNLDTQKLWLLYAVIAQISCMVGCVFGHYQAVYSGFADLQNQNKLSLLTGTGIGYTIHGLLCMIVSKFGMPYLFFASPVMYIARFIGKGTRSLYADVSFDFPRRAVLAAIGIYIILVYLGCCIGCMIGCNKVIKENSCKP